MQRLDFNVGMSPLSGMGLHWRHMGLFLATSVFSATGFKLRIEAAMFMQHSAAGQNFK